MIGWIVVGVVVVGGVAVAWILSTKTEVSTT